MVGSPSKKTAPANKLCGTNLCMSESSDFSEPSSSRKGGKRGVSQLAVTELCNMYLQLVALTLMSCYMLISQLYKIHDIH